MMIRFANALVFALILAWSAMAQPLEQKMPKTVIFYMGGETTEEMENAFPNFNQAIQKLFESLDDILEWRVIESEWQAAVEKAGGSDAFNALHGNPWAMGLTGIDQSNIKLPSLIYLAQVTDPQKADLILAGFFDSLAKAVPTLQAEVDDYHGAAIHSLFGPGMIPGLGISYGFQDNLLVVSNSKPQIIRLFDQWEYDEENLTDNPIYQQVKAQLPAEHNRSFFYDNTQLSGGIKSIIDSLREMQKMNEEDAAQKHSAEQSSSDEKTNAQEATEDVGDAMAEIGEEIEEEIEDAIAEAAESIQAEGSVPDVTAQQLVDLQKQIDEISQQFGGAFSEIGQHADFNAIVNVLDTVYPLISAIQASGVAWSLGADGFELTHAVCLLDSQLLNSDSPFSPFFKRTPVVFSFKDYLPRRTGSYTATNFGTLKDVWTIVQTIIQQLPNGAEGLEQFRAIQQEFGFSLEEDLLSWMGDEWSIVRPVMDLDSVVPINRGALIIKVTDNAKAAQGLAKLTQVLSEKLQIPIKAQIENYENREITYYSLPIPIMPVIPAWSLDGDHLILTSHIAQLRDMLAVKSGKARGGIERNKYYQPLSGYFDQPANKITFQDIESEVYANREAVRRVASISEVGEIIDSDEQMLPFVVLDRVSYLLTCMQIYKASVKRSWLDNEWLRSEKVVIKRDLANVPPDNYILRYKISLGLKDGVAELAAYCSDHGDTERAARLYSILSEFYPKEGEYLSALAAIHSREGKIQESAEVFDKAMEIMPETSLLIERERVTGDANAPAIIQRVQEAASKSERVKADAALFGIALQLRDQEKVETALELLQALIDQHPSSLLKSAAQAELDLMQNGKTADSFDVPLSVESPDDDLATHDDAWEKAKNLSVQMTSSEGKTSQAEVKILRTPTALHFQLQGDLQKDDDELRMDEAALHLNPSRDYIHWIDINVKKAENEEDELFHEVRLTQRTTNFFDILLGGAQNAFMVTAMPAKTEQDEDRWMTEFSIPLKDIEKFSQAKPKDVWLFNVNLPPMDDWSKAVEIDTTLFTYANMK